VTAIFISHSSKDQEPAAAMKAWLEAQGHSSLFLDFDPDAGIRAGSDWEQTLYRKLRQCQAVIALITPSWLGSKWCFAEIVQAREKGKAIFPVRVAPCDPGGLLADLQHIDLTIDANDGYRRLELGLKERGLDPSRIFPWDPQAGRPPYPGLLAFQEEDAAIFFGRNEEILEGLETLEHLQRRGREAPRLLLLLGASGSGKSSLVRAGLIPRLKRDPTKWLPLQPFRPGPRPVEQLGQALAKAFSASGTSPGTDDIIQRVARAAEEDPPRGAELIEIVRDLRNVAERQAATVVISIDQAEELFGLAPADQASSFLCFLRAGLECADRELMVLATMRSDFLGAFQIHPVLQDREFPHPFPYRTLEIDPLPLQRFREIIEGPADLAGLEIEEGLADEMINDAGTRDALPLLAYTLHRLYRRAEESGGRRAASIAVADYRALGGVSGAIQRGAERVLEELRPSAQQMEALRAVFLPHLVRIGEDGQYVRHRAHRERLPRLAQPLIDRLVDARLLIIDRNRQSGQETVEVAHEALLRTWPLLTRWLQEDELKLRQHQSLLRAAGEWEERGRAADLLVHRDGRLEDARALTQDDRFAPAGESTESAYLDACVAQQTAREAADRRRTRRVIAGLAIGLVVVAGLGGLAYRQAVVAYEQRNAAVAQRDRALRAESQRLAAAAEGFVERDPDRAVLLARYALVGDIGDRAEPQAPPSSWDFANTVARAIPFARCMLVDDLAEPQERPYTWQAADVLLRGLSLYRDHLLDLPTPADTSATFILGGARILTASNTGVWAVWDARTGERLAGRDEREGRGPNRIKYLEVADDGTAFLTAWDHTARLWDANSGEELQRFEHSDTHGPVFAATFSSDRTRVVTASYDGTARVWDVESGQELKRLRHEDGWGPISAAVFAADDTRLVTASYGDRTARIWDTATGMLIGESLPYADEWRRFGLAVSGDGAHVVVPGPGSVQVIDAQSGQVSATFEGVAPEIVAAIVGASGVPIPVVLEDEMESVWAVFADERLAAWAGRDRPAVASPLSRDRSRLVTLSDERAAIVWDVEAQTPIARVVGEDVSRASFSPDGTRLVTGAEQGARLWDVQLVRTVNTFDVDERERSNDDIQPYSTGDIADAHCGPEGARLLTYGLDRYNPPIPLVWDSIAGTRTPLKGDFEQWKATHFAASFTPDASHIIARLPYGTEQRVWDAKTGAELTGSGTLPSSSSAAGDDTGAAKRLAVSPDESLVVVSEENTAELRRQSDDAVVAVLPHNDQVRDAAFSINGARLITASRDGTAHIWEASAGKLLDILEHEGAAVHCAAFSTDGDHVITAASDGVVRRWDVTQFQSFDDVLALARRVIPRDLSGDEKRAHGISIE
jgi:WD40 repeat protein